MHRFAKFVFCSTAAVALCVPPAGATEPSVPTHVSIEAAMAAAEQSGKVVMVDVNGRPWCDPCNAMGRNVLDTAEFRQWVRKSVEWVEIAVPLDRDFEDDGSGDAPVWHEVMSRYGVQGLPTVLILDGAGEEVARMHGAAGPEHWIEKAEEAVRRARERESR